jgi:hypothetical protein
VAGSYRRREEMCTWLRRSDPRWTQTPRRGEGGRKGGQEKEPVCFFWASRVDPDARDEWNELRETEVTSSAEDPGGWKRGELSKGVRVFSGRGAWCGVCVCLAGG